MSASQKDFETLRHMHNFLEAELDREIDELTDQEIQTHLRKTRVDVASLVQRTKNSLARAHDREIRAQARERISKTNELAKTIMTDPKRTLDSFRERLKILFQQDPSFAVLFRGFENLEDQSELERAWILLERLEEQDRENG